MSSSDISEGPDGLYPLCVFKADDLSDEQIHDEFGRFGKICQINRVQDIIFPRFRNRDDAVACFTSMLNQTRFIVKPGKNKASSQSPQNIRSGKSVETSQRNQEMSRHYEKGYQGRKSDDETGSTRNKWEKTAIGVTVEDKLPPMPNLTTIYAPELPPDPDMPKAKIVVIANLPVGFKQKNIYDLCSGEQCKVKPLHVAMKIINRPSEPEIHYSYVYFKTEAEVNTIVAYLDNLVINGYSLVVKSVNELLEDD